MDERRDGLSNAIVTYVCVYAIYGGLKIIRNDQGMPLLNYYSNLFRQLIKANEMKKSINCALSFSVCPNIRYIFVGWDLILWSEPLCGDHVVVGGGTYVAPEEAGRGEERIQHATN